MKLGRVRVGERFVFDHIGGVYNKVSANKARCIYGKNFGKEERISPDVSVYVIFEDRDKLKKMGAPREQDDPMDCSAGVVNTAAVQEPVPVADTQPDYIGIVNPDFVPTPACEPVRENAMQIVVLDEDENVIQKIPNATMQQVVAFAQAEGVKLGNNNKSRDIRETFYDYADSTYVVMVGREM